MTLSWSIPEHDSPLSLSPAFSILLGWCIALFLCGRFAAAPSFFERVGVSLAAMLATTGWTACGLRRNFSGTLGIFLLLACLSCAGAFYFTNAFFSPMPPEGRVELSGLVTLERSWGRGRVALLDSKKGRFAVWLPLRTIVKEGDRVVVSGRVTLFERTQIEREFDEALCWRGLSAAAKIRAERVRGVPRESIGLSLSERFAGALHRWREVVRTRILLTQPPRVRGYLLAAWLGVRDPELALQHAEWGTSHILAISGFHVGVLVAAATFLLSYFGRGSPLSRVVAVSVVMWAYIAFAGASASSLRAGAVCQLVLLGRLMGNPGNAFNSVAGAGLALLAFNPWLFWSVAFRLSMLSVLTLCALPRAFPEFWSGARNATGLLGGALFASAAVWLVTAFPVTWTFESVPLIGIFINLAAFTYFAATLPLASFAALPALVQIPGGGVASAAAEWVFFLWERAADLLAVLCPFKIAYSMSLAAASAAFAFFCFARASGYGRFRGAAVGFCVASVMIII